MSLQHMVRACVITLIGCLSAMQANAKYHLKVGVSQQTSALPVLATDASHQQTSSPVTATDTIKSFEQMVKELKQEMANEQNTHDEVSDPDSIISTPVDTARLRHMTDSLTAQPLSTKAQKPPMFVPNPTKALWLSLVLPGAGQIYNRKYWKLPIIYGGFIGCAYALTWNQMMYRDYSQAYLDIMDDDPNTKSYLDMLPPRYDITGREDQFKAIFKRKKDFYRRYRDLSAFCFVGVYLLSVVDAYVDAQLSVFDISPDLSMKVEPAVIGTPNMMGSNNRAAYGVGCSLRF